MIPLLAAALFLTALGKKLHLTNIELVCWLFYLVCLELLIEKSAIYLLIALFIIAPFTVRLRNSPYAQPLFRLVASIPIWLAII